MEELLKAKETITRENVYSTRTQIPVFEGGTATSTGNFTGRYIGADLREINKEIKYRKEAALSVKNAKVAQTKLAKGCGGIALGGLVTIAGMEFIKDWQKSRIRISEEEKTALLQQLRKKQDLLTILQEMSDSL